MIMNLRDEDNIRDHLVDLDDLGKPRIISMEKIEPGIMNTAITCIARLILMRKGTDMDRPDMGIDIVRNYRFADVSDLYKLQNDIDEQVTMYLPEFSPVTVTVTPVVQEFSDKNITVIYIGINIDGTMYQLLYNTSESKLDFLQY